MVSYLLVALDLIDLMTLSGWGKTAPTLTRVVEASLPGISESISGQVSIPRGLGRAYGDCAVNGGGTTVLMTRINNFELRDGFVDAAGGASLDSILQTIIPHGWFIPVTPGTRFVTVGGAIAADVHGKNHHCDGSFSQHVEFIDLLLASGEVRRVGPSDQLFWATAGGMGLTGIILKARIKLLKIESSLISTLTFRAANLDELMDLMKVYDGMYRYSVAWVDSLARGRSLGRGVVSFGNHATVAELNGYAKDELLDARFPRSISAPNHVPNSFLNKKTIRAFNEFWYRKNLNRQKITFESIVSYFYPLDGVDRWNQIYGNRGFVQYQFVVPDESGEVVRVILERLAQEQVPSFLTVLKRFGRESDGYLSFPTSGWTMAIDIPTDVAGLGKMLDEFDSLLLDVGGRVYLAKDSRVRRDRLALMYPKLSKFAEMRVVVDPDRKFQSNLSRRLGL